MLKEIPNVRQYEGEPLRRWFWSDLLDLTVWYGQADRIVGFQLCYQKGKEGKALTWFEDKGYTHDTVDDGEGRPGGYKMTPILVPDGLFDKDRIAGLFEAQSADMAPEAARFILSKIKASP